MKKAKLIFYILFGVSFLLDAQVKYYDAADFPVFGKITNDTETLYQRLPKALNGKVRDRLWVLGTNSSGLYIRFCTNSKSIAAKWEVNENVVLNHMTPAGIKGLDLYSYVDGCWQFVNSARPVGKESTARMIDHMRGDMREYMLYLPLYDGTNNLQIGVDSAATIKAPEINSPVTERPVVYYGTSITQGGCASRPGMSYTNILARKLDRQVINLGFSGNGQLDYEIADLMALSDASVFVLDFLPNVNVKQINERTEEFVRRIRAKHSNTPIVIVGNIIYPHSYFDEHIAAMLKEKNKAIEMMCIKLKKQGLKRIYYIKPDKLIGGDGEATIDGIHLTDLGFMRYADSMFPIIRKYLN